MARFLLNGVAASPHCLVTLCAKKIRREEKHTHTHIKKKKEGKEGKKKKDKTAMKPFTANRVAIPLLPPFSFSLFLLLPFTGESDSVCP